MRCLSVMTKALQPGDDKGTSVLLGGKRALKVADMFDARALRPGHGEAP